MWIDKLNKKHYEALFEIVRRAEPYMKNLMFEQFVQTMDTRVGYVVVRNDGKLAGSINFSDYVPGQNIIVHCFVDPAHHKRWRSKKLLRIGFDYVFNRLDLPRLSGFCIPGVSDKAGKFLLSLGFRHEGLVRKGALLPDGLHYDVKLFGMLKEECRWL